MCLVRPVQVTVRIIDAGVHSVRKKSQLHVRKSMDASKLHAGVSHKVVNNNWSGINC